MYASVKLLPFAQLRTGPVKLPGVIVKLLGCAFRLDTIEPIANTATVTTTAMLIENFIRSVLIVLLFTIYLCSNT